MSLRRAGKERAAGCSLSIRPTRPLPARLSLSGEVEVRCEAQLFQPGSFFEPDNLVIIRSPVPAAPANLIERRPASIRPHHDVVRVIGSRLVGHGFVLDLLRGTIPADASQKGTGRGQHRGTRGTPPRVDGRPPDPLSALVRGEWHRRQWAGRNDRWQTRRLAGLRVDRWGSGRSHYEGAAVRGDATGPALDDPAKKGPPPIMSTAGRKWRVRHREPSAAPRSRAGPRRSRSHAARNDIPPWERGNRETASDHACRRATRRTSRSRAKFVTGSRI